MKKRITFPNLLYRISYFNILFEVQIYFFQHWKVMHNKSLTRTIIDISSPILYSNN
jgi:hypothetical protein